MDFKNITFSIIVPVYNEELVINETYKRIKEVMEKTEKSYEVIFIDDGSKDKTSEILMDICSKDQNIKQISFSRNFGHQIAITAGLDFSSGQAIVIIDADLQDPPEVILSMIDKWKEGYDVVYGKRLKRKGETFIKKFTAKMFYSFLRTMTAVDIPNDTGDFRLIDRKVCDVLKSLPERNRYVRGLVSWVGYKQTGIEYVREERFAGKTKYPYKKMIKFAFDAITSFSYKPLKIATFFGMIISVLSFLYLLFTIYQKLFTNTTQPGWASLIVISLFFNGLILLILGIIGEYIGRIFDEAKGRPLYVVSKSTGFKKDE